MVNIWSLANEKCYELTITKGLISGITKFSAAANMPQSFLRYPYIPPPKNWCVNIPALCNPYGETHGPVNLTTMMTCPPEMGCGGNAGNTPPPPPTDTCAKAKAAADSAKALFDRSRLLESINNLLPNRATDTLEKGFFVVANFQVNPYNNQDTTSLSYQCSPVQTGANSTITLTPPPYYPNRQFLASAVHTHPNGGYPCPSADDFYGSTAFYLDSNFYAANTYVAAYDGSVYSFSVSNPAALSAFNATRSQYLDGEKWKEGSEARNYHKKVMIEFRKNGLPEFNAFELAQAATLMKYSSGLTISKRDASGNFQLLLWRKRLRKKGGKQKPLSSKFVNNKKMKKVILFLCVMSLMSYHQTLKAQILPQPNDTLAIIKRIVDNKNLYIGQPFQKILDSLTIQIKDFTPLGFQTKLEENTVFSFYHPDNMQDAYLIYPCLDIYWQTPLNKTTSLGYFNAYNRGMWNTTVQNFYKNAIVREIYLDEGKY